MAQYVHIPKAKIGVLIGPNGSTKKQIEINTETELHVDSEEGVVAIERKGNDPVGELVAADIIKAVARGFKIDKALQLSETNSVLEVVSLKDYESKQKDIERIRARIIGAEGKSRKQIEKLTETDISIYGNTVSIIGRMENVSIAKQAVDRLASGQEHSTVFKFLERSRRTLIGQ